MVETDGKHGKTMKSMNKTQFYHRILIMFHLDTHVYDIFLSMGENIDGPIYILWNQHLRNQAQKSIE